MTDYRGMLADLERQKADAEAGIALVHRLMGASPQNSPRPRKASPRDVPRRILAFLADRPGKPFTPPEIAREAGIKQLDSLRAALARMARQKRIQKAGRGKYRSITKTSRKTSS